MSEPTQIELDEITHATLIAYANEQGITPEEAANRLLAEYLTGEQDDDNVEYLTE
jgi:hypothetical protein